MRVRSTPVASFRAARAWLLLAALVPLSCSDLKDNEIPTPPGAGGTGPGSTVEAGASDAGGSDGDGGTEPEDSSCRTHRDCNPEVSDDPRICLRSRCVRLRNDDPSDPSRGGTCVQVLGAEHLAAGAEPFVFGALTAVFQPVEIVPATRNYDLAIREFAARGGVPIAGTTRFPMAVLCDALAERESLARTFDHLVHTLDVPAVLTPLAPVELKWAFEHVHANWEKAVLFLSPFQSDNTLVQQDDRGLLWHLLGGPQDLVPVYVSLVERVEDYVKRTTGLSQIRLALVDAETSFESDLGNLLHKQLRFNGKSPAENGDAYLRLRLPTWDAIDELWDTHLPKIQEFLPHVVVFTGGSEATLLMGSLESSWPELSGAFDPGPFYVLSPTQAGQRPELRNMLSGLGLHDRVAGVNFAAADDSTLYDEYLSAFEATFAQDAHLAGTENFYDAIYYLIYAAVAAGDEQPLDGTRMASGLQRLLNGPAHAVGGLHIPDVVAALRTEPSIALHGTLGPPAFDPVTGAWRGNGSVFCVEPNEGTIDFRMDVLKYDRNTGALTGTFPCIDGF